MPLFTKNALEPQSFIVEFILPTATTAIEMECLGRCDHAHVILPAVCVLCQTGSHTVEQIKKNLWLFMRLVIITHIGLFAQHSCIVNKVNFEYPYFRLSVLHVSYLL